MSVFVLCGAVAAQPAEGALAALKAKGRITFGVYNDFPPYHRAGEGVEVDLAHAIAAKLGVKASLLGFEASDENMEDDLRNMVWKGHYLGWGPADVLLHVPATPALKDAVPQVSIVAPYHTVRLAVAFDTAQLKQFDNLADLGEALIGTEQASIGSLLVARQDGGRFRGNLRHFRNASLAVADLRAGKLAAVIALRGELEAALAGQPRYRIVSAPFPVSVHTAWPVGMAVKKASTDLAAALTAAVAELTASGELARIFARHHVTAAPPEGVRTP